MRYKIRFKGLDASPKLYAMIFDYGVIADNWVGEDGKFSDEWQNGRLKRLGIKVMKEVGAQLYDDDEVMREIVIVGTKEQLIGFENKIEETLQQSGETGEDYFERALEEEIMVRELDEIEAEQFRNKAEDWTVSNPMNRTDKTNGDLLWTAERKLIEALEATNLQAAQKHFVFIYGEDSNLEDLALDGAQYEDLLNRRDKYIDEINKIEEYKKGGIQ